MIWKLIKNISAAGIVFLSRFASLPANFSPLGSLGFFGNNGWLFFATIVAHDYLKSGFYAGFWATYLGFAMYLVLGRVAHGKLKRQFLLLPAASLLFFVFSNLGVWWYWRDHTMQSLITTFVLALPFYRNTFLGDLVFGYGYLVIRELRAKGFISRKAGIIGLSKNQGEVA